MRELFLIASESTEQSLVLAAAPNPEADDERFFLTLSDATRAPLTPPVPQPRPEPVRPPAPVRPLPTEPDPRLTAPLPLRPREIQERVRGGAGVAELAEELGVLESRLEPYAHPVLQERSRIAELARSAHPLRESGPARLSLAEVLATAFAARGISAEEAQWDAYRDAGHQWVVSVAFQEDGSRAQAEWVLQNYASGSPTAAPRNMVATELTDPESILPPVIPEPAPNNVTALSLAEPIELPDEEAHGEEFPDLPETEDALPPAKRRRKAVTPHWEDVLLGVRTNTKRPKK